MRKYAFVVVALSILLMAGISLAQVPRSDVPSTDGKTSFTNIAVRGVDVAGVPGYIEMYSTANTTFYLYIDDYGKLRIASDVAVGSGASPQTTDWNNVGTVVGGQS